MRYSSALRFLSLGLILSLGGAGASESGPATWAPVNGIVPAGGFVVNTQSRIESLAFYNAVYLASAGAEHRIGWTGNYGNCNPGNTDPAFQEDVRRRVNYYRALCGLPANITFDADPAQNDGPAGSPQVAAATTKRTAAQASAYMNAFSNVFFENFALTHNPLSSKTVCYTNAAWNGSWHSNLTIGYFGPRAIDVYMADDDTNDAQANNVDVGHRRWILFSRAKDMSSGDVPRGTYTDASGSYPVLPANSLYVTGIFHPSADSPKQFVSWPPPGYVPLPLKPIRWSLSYPNAVFTGSPSAVSLKGPSGNTIPVTVVSSSVNTIGDNTLVFQPHSLETAGNADTTFTVTVTGMSGTGVPATHTWQTTFFDPALLGVTQTVSGPANPRATGSQYEFNEAPLAGGYQILVNAPAAASDYTENGDGAAPDLVVDKTGSYPLLQGPGSLGGLNFLPRSGSKSIHLCFPLDETEVDYLPHAQSFMLGPEFIPSPTSTLTFHELFRWLFNVNRFSVEISTDGGTRWQEIYGRNGAYSYAPGASYSSSGWDHVWHARSVSLANYAGQLVRLRFILRPGRLSFDGPDINHGCFVDDIVLTQVRQLSQGATNTQVATLFNLDSNTAGSQLVAGNPYLIRVRPEIGLRYLGYSGALMVVPVPPTGFETAWPAYAHQPHGDADQDGIPNLMEYAFGLNLTVPELPIVLPQPVAGPDGLTLSFPLPSGRQDLSYTAESTVDFTHWAPVGNQGTPEHPVFHLPVNTGTNAFMRLRVTQLP